MRVRIRNLIITTVKAQRQDAKRVGKVILDKDETIMELRGEIRELKGKDRRAK